MRINKIFLRCLALILLGLLVYGQTFRFGFVFDDNLFIVANPFIKNFSNFHMMWHTFPLTRLVGMYSFALNYYFNQLDARGYHIFNFIVHLIATGLVWALADLLFKITARTVIPAQAGIHKDLPFIIALLFLVHPCQTQAVTYITQRFESMAAVFYFGTIYFYLRARLSTVKTHQMALFGLAGLATILGVLTKEVIMTVPVMVLACEWILLNTVIPAKAGIHNKHYLTILAAGFLLCLLFSKMLHLQLVDFSKTIPSESHDGDVFTTAHYVLTQMRVFLTFLRLLVLPIHQNVDYDYPASTGFLHPPLTLAGLGVILGFIFLIIKLRRSFPLIAFGLAWMLITFSVNLVPRFNVIFEHKLYLISFGFILAFVSALSVLVWKKPGHIDFLGIQKVNVSRFFLYCLVFVLAFMSFQRNKVWANELALWENNIKESPGKARVNASLGRVYGSLGRLDASIYYLSRAIAISPNNITYENRGIIYGQQGRTAQALEDLNKSIAMDPNYFSTYVKRAWVYQTQHNYKEALDDLGRAIALEPQFEDAYMERGMLWMQAGRAQEALKDFQQVLSIDPLNPEAARDIKLCRLANGRHQ